MSLRTKNRRLQKIADDAVKGVAPLIAERNALRNMLDWEQQQLGTRMEELIRLRHEAEKHENFRERIRETLEAADRGESLLVVLGRLAEVARE
jgi:pyruvate-formate lyase